ncbi:uncharacterized protein LOC123308613 isoform X2 [Coccinella septempunctata]|uniref:uncharacterized protein LOC123308613 isoform X2 n=1 Tax=Coccinella septempunctata TaxID=41139 RepID=UPI001D06A292|nr:uncharacterized protein LOC123308613 isoform X2 [Coccinella septempunctata]
MTSVFADAKSKFSVVIATMIVLVFCIISGNYLMRKQISSSLVQFGKIDNALLRFNTRICYKDLRKDNMGLMILMFSSVVIRSVIMIILIDLDFLQSVTVFGVLSVKALTKYQFISYIKQLSKRFEKVNDTLKDIFERSTKDKIIFNHLTYGGVISEGILIMCRQHHHLCQWMRILNNAFGLQQLTSIAVSVCNVLFQTYYLYFVLAENQITILSIFTPLIWTLDEMMEIQLLVTSCVEVCDNANSTAAILHEMRNDNFNVSLEESIVGAVTTYLVIFIQFDQGSRKTEVIDSTDTVTVLPINNST